VHQFLYSLVEAVMDNAIYHSVQVNKTCNLWLEKRQIE
jgi:hypothetical protein